MSETYNGWSNYETWNVALWIQNDERLYTYARTFRNRRNPYASLAKELISENVIKTPDGVKYNDTSLDIDELDAMMQEL